MTMKYQLGVAPGVATVVVITNVPVPVEEIKALAARAAELAGVSITMGAVA